MSMEQPVKGIEFVGSNGLRLRADVAGPDKGPPILFLHGGGQTRHAWRRALQILGNKGWRAIAIDSRGHGESEWDPNGDYGVDALCEDLCTVVQALDTKPVLVGASMGGHTALIAQATSGNLARALVLVDVVPQLETQGVQHIIDFMTARPDGFSNLDEVADAVAAYTPNRSRPRDPQGLVKNLRLAENGRWYWHWDPKFIQTDAMERQARILNIRDRMQAAAAHITVPVLLVRGAESDVVSAEGVNALKAQIPQLETIDIPDAGHMVAGDKNDHFLSGMLDFLERLETSVH